MKKKKLRILIVEDVPSDAELLEFQLRKGGMEFISECVETKEAFLKMLREFKPDLILSDYSLPHFDGMTALRLTQELAPTIPFILVTGSMNEETAVECMKAGAWDYVIKDHIVRIIPAIKAALEKMRIAEEKERTEKNLKESEERYKSLFERVPVGLYRTIPEGQVIDVNPALVRLLGYSSREEMLDLRVTDGYADEKEHERWQTLMEREGVVRGFEAQWRKHDGTIIWVRESAQAIRDNEGRIMYYEGVVEDITEHKQAEAALKASEEQYKALYESSSYAIMILEPPDYKFKSGNPAALKMFNIKDEKKFISFTPFELSPEYQPDRQLSSQKAIKMIDKAMKEGSNYFEWTHERYNGDKFPATVLLTRIKLRGKVLLQATVSDITERKKAEEKLQKIEWLLTKGVKSKSLLKEGYQQAYGSVVELDTNRLILDSVGEDALSDIADEFLDLLDTCAAVYEKNGDYAYGNFTSDWCRFLDQTSRQLCGAGSNKEALASGKWICHESCWNEVSRVSIETAQPVDIECKGGLRIYAMPIWAGKEIVGSINFGYGDPPTDQQKIQELAARYNVSPQKLLELANSYESRPPYIIDLAKKRLLTAAKMIGEIAERKKAERVLRESEERFKLITETITEAFWMADSKIGKMLYISPAYEKIWGRTQQSLYDNPKSFIEAMHGADRAKVLANLEAQKTGHPFDHEYRIIRPDGSMRWIWDRGFPVRDQNGQINNYVGIAQDITERKNAEEEKTRLFTLSNDLICAVGFDGYMKQLNPAWEKLLGWTNQELMSKPFVEFIHPEDRESTQEVVNGLTESKPAILFENRYICKDGSCRQISWNSVSNIEESVIYAIGRDITERNKAEEELKDSERKYRTLVESASDQIFMVDKECKLISVNTTALRLFGKKPDEIIGKHISEVFPKEIAEENLKSLEKVFKTGESVFVVDKMIVGEHEFWSSTSLNPVKNDSGEIIAILGIARDITERKKVEKELMESEEKFRELFEGANDGMLLVDPDDRRFYIANKRICQMLGYTKEEIMNLTIADITPKESLPHAIEEFEKQMRGEAEMATDLPLKRKDGSIFYADINSNPITISGKTRLLGMFRDSTERMKAEDALRRAKDGLEIRVKERTVELEELNKKLKETSSEVSRAMKVKSEFLANMSHELRTPLNSVIGFSEVLYDQTFGPLNEKQKEYLNYVLVSGKHLLSLINDVLDLAKVEAGKMEITVSTLSVKAILEESSILVKRSAFKKNIKISLEVPADIGNIQADERKLKEVLFNLLSNAIKFTPEGGKAGIKAWKTSSEIGVEIWDTGIGIAPENLERVFEAFARIETPYSRLTEGTGLGLPLSKKLVELHGGRIWIESGGINKGTQVKFTLPIKQ